MAPASCNDPTHADLLGMIQRLAEQFEEQKQKHAAEVAALRAEIADLRAKLGRDSSNSSKPPSSDSPYKRSPPKVPSGRKPSGQGWQFETEQTRCDRCPQPAPAPLPPPPPPPQVIAPPAAPTR